MRNTEQKNQAGKRLYTSILLALLAFVAVVVFHCRQGEGQDHESGGYRRFRSSDGSGCP